MIAPVSEITGLHTITHTLVIKKGSRRSTVLKQEGGVGCGGSSHSVAFSITTRNLPSAALNDVPLQLY